MVWRTASGSCFCSARLMSAVWMGGSTRTCTGNGPRNHRCAGLDGNAECTGLELTGAALFALVAGAFREDDEAPAALHDGGGVVQRAHRGADIVALDENAAQQLHPAVEQRNFSQLFLGEDAIGLIKAGQQQRDVIITAVVRHKDAGAILRDVVQSLDAEPDAGDIQDAFAPMGDVLFYQLAHRLGVACGQRTLGFAQHTVMDDHVPEQINE